MVHKRKDRPNEGYRVWIRLPGFGEVGPWQTGLHKKAQAERVEAWLKEMALTRPEVIQGIVDGRYSLQEAWVAELRRRLDELVADINDPPLEQAVEEYRPHCEDPRARTGLNQILHYAPDGARLSWLREAPERRGVKAPRHVAQLYRAAIADDRSPNSVQRSLHRAVRELLIYQLGEEEAEARLRGLEVPSEDDTRDVRIEPGDVLRLMQGSPVDRFNWMVATAILTTADRKPLLRARAKDFDGEGFAIRDTKNPNRPRTLDASWEPLNTVLRLATAGLEPDDRIFPWTPGQVRNLWEALRDDLADRPTRHKRRRGEVDPVGREAKQLYQEEGIVTLPILRWKDLRHLLPTALRAVGASDDEIQLVLGHAAGSSQTARYIARRGDPKKLEAAAELLGVGTLHLKAG